MPLASEDFRFLPFGHPPLRAFRAAFFSFSADFDAPPFLPISDAVISRTYTETLRFESSLPFIRPLCHPPAPQ